MEQVVYRDLGRIAYQEGWEIQEALFAEVVRIKLARRDRGEAHKNGKHYLLFCEHDPVFTLGRNGVESNLLINPEHLASLGIDYHKIN
ncbi:MAG: lipoyl(octanoyl) transferase, partial [Limisphaerales bacterium]